MVQIASLVTVNKKIVLSSIHHGYESTVVFFVVGVESSSAELLTDFTDLTDFYD
jgi:hypothetical protein